MGTPSRNAVARVHNTRYVLRWSASRSYRRAKYNERDMGASRCTDGNWPPKHGEREGRETVRRLLRPAAEAVAEAAAVAAAQIAAEAAVEGRS